MCKTIKAGGRRCLGENTPRQKRVKLTDPTTIASSAQWEALDDKQKVRFSGETVTRWNHNVDKNEKAKDKYVKRAGNAYKPQATRSVEATKSQVFKDTPIVKVNLPATVTAEVLKLKPETPADEKASSTGVLSTILKSTPHMTDESTEAVLQQSRKVVNAQEQDIHNDRQLADSDARAGRYGATPKHEQKQLKTSVTADEQKALRRKALGLGLTQAQYTSRLVTNYHAQHTGHPSEMEDMRSHVLSMSKDARAEREIWLTTLSDRERAKHVASLLQPHERIERLGELNRIVARGEDAIHKETTSIKSLEGIRKEGLDDFGRYSNGFTEAQVRAKIQLHQAKLNKINESLSEYKEERRGYQESHQADLQARLDAGAKIKRHFENVLTVLPGRGKNSPGVKLLTAFIRGVDWSRV